MSEVTLSEIERRLAVCEQAVKDLSDKITATDHNLVATTTTLNSVLATLGELKGAVESLKARPATMWDKLIYAVIGAAGAAIITYLIGVVLEFLSQYGYILAYTALTAIAGVLGAGMKKLYDKATADDTKRKVVETCVKAVEQLYQDLSGTEKLEKAKENIIAMLDIKGISISEIEMDMLIEACVAEFNLAFLQKAKEERMEAKENGSNVSETR